MVMKMIKDLDPPGPLAVVSRGYGRKRRGVIEVKEGSDYRQVGDEPLMIKKNFPHTPVIVSKNRHRGARAAVSAGARAVLLDDGFQSWELKRDMDIVLIDSRDPFGGGKILPFGRLREPVEALKRADAVIITRCNCDEDTGVEETRKKVRSYTGAEIFTSYDKITGFREVFGTGEAGPDFIRGKNVLSFSAVGGNERFRDMIKSLGGRIIEKIEKIDHYKWKRGDIKQIEKIASAGSLVAVTTEKDAVKLAGFKPFNCYWARLETVIEEQKRWKEKINEVFS